MEDDSAGDPAAVSQSRRPRPLRFRFGRPQLIVIAAIVAIGIGLAGWAVLRARPIALAVPHDGTSATASPSGASGAQPTGAPSRPARAAESSSAAGDPDGATPGTGGQSSAGASPSASVIKVHVTGAVKKPGVLMLRKGDRVEDAIDKAGGAKRNADLGDLNLAQLLSDGQQLVIAKEGHSAEPEDTNAPDDPADSTSHISGSDQQDDDDTGTDGSSAGTKNKINLNDASESELEELSGVGPVMAQKIVEWRQENGRFNTIKELQEIDGIGPKRSADLAGHVTVS